MLKSYTFWLKTAAVLQILTAAIHSLSFLADPQGTNDNEKKMLELMQIKLDAGYGFAPSQWDLFMGLSACFTLAYLLGGLINFYLVQKKVDVAIMKGIILINVIVFGAGFVIMYFFTFIYPVVLTGLVFVLLVASWFTLPKQSQSL
jgi:hypothetical protein